MDDLDLSGLSVQAATAYVMEFVTSLKMTDQDLTRLREELSTWTKRVELAASKSAADLEAAARAKATELTARCQTLEAEKTDLEYKIKRLREKLPLVGLGQRSIDPDLLLAEMKILTGEDLTSDGPSAATTSRNIDALGAVDALEALKRQLNPPAEAAAETPVPPPAAPPSPNKPAGSA
ncbi:MAG: hypothetical protein A2087_01660 [Spirochaetes bacterium GWD1_61_31]|nr:MAG: hypothetical protein A2Y37_10425 [Spirochaetes bacterium GWB1_60_80]OHD29739.1 MAG: hypothetical protein A2004_04700 [Spirochaetes bacterium GWC1_61_12]OHD35781.1 MAG: hypothetical protein A2087_01660 [Spirochaetes bacterium GWD1_61_31]OHD42918.1 MAG: hypothetical protein A2Y35_14095 [Spirochaetes bacterium GWE1_60_18]OHD61282.1 MAG: hypothetical protein A2Y32_04120 [Spirochaetes bacterium GWF1_60_12]HAP43786.1 hypothetical protein [Spirochaetaceae bacterium]